MSDPVTKEDFIRLANYVSHWHDTLHKHPCKAVVDWWKLARGCTDYQMYPDGDVDVHVSKHTLCYCYQSGQLGGNVLAGIDHYFDTADITTNNTLEVLAFIANWVHANDPIAVYREDSGGISMLRRIADYRMAWLATDVDPELLCRCLGLTLRDVQQTNLF